jgi:hypothetical protein
MSAGVNQRGSVGVGKWLLVKSIKTQVKAADTGCISSNSRGPHMAPVGAGVKEAARAAPCTR